jgi:hypothetical protein
MEGVFVSREERLGLKAASFVVDIGLVSSLTCWDTMSMMVGRRSRGKQMVIIMANFQECNRFDESLFKRTMDVHQLI